ncbi:ROK family protein [Lignipirellula cremea]|uniref:Glucokinase n=1 Tax=Lignipirellula cremea TaxID=2528010 RepID=A0A518DQY1_9BACT|nr:ROK family protein [Lignipirellula cremea]QDU94250.1 Glucokinase [Lignipirellula cremea]
MAKQNEGEYWLGFDLGGTKMLGAIFDAEFKPVVRVRKKTKAFLGQKAGVERICEVINEALEEANLKTSQIAGIGIGVPGPLDLNRGVVLETPNLGWKNLPLQASLEKEFKCSAVILNDVDAGVYGEYRFGSAKDARCVIGVFPGTGIGGGCVYEGTILRGKTSSCMEIGHMLVAPDGPLCGCGRYGCLEAVASRLAVSAAAAQAAHRGDAPHLMKEAGADLMKIRSGALADSVKNGDKVVEQLLRDAGRHMGLAVASLVNLLAPDVVVLGGGMVEEMPKLFVEEVKKAAKNRVMPSYENSFEVVAAALGDDSAAMGAAAWVQKAVLAGASPPLFN